MPSGSITVVQTASVNSGASSGSVSITFGSTPTVGNLMVFIFAGLGSQTYKPNVDIGRMGYLQVNNEVMIVWARTVQSGDGKTYTITQASGTDSKSLYAIEFSNAGYVNCIIVDSGRASSSTDTSRGAVGTALYGTAYALAAFMNDNGSGSNTWGSGWNKDVDLNNGSYAGSHGMTVAHRNLTPANGAVPAVVTWANAETNNNNPSCMIIVNPAT